ncbi:MAG: hypothetical protein ACRBK7_13940 [Acidimicrobiales bacterium]
MEVETMSLSPEQTAVSREQSICPRRLSALNTAVELEVDEDEIEFESEQEAEMWRSLRTEFEEFVAKIGPIWIAD